MLQRLSYADFDVYFDEGCYIGGKDRSMATVRDEQTDERCMHKLYRYLLVVDVGDSVVVWHVVWSIIRVNGAK